MHSIMRHRFVTEEVAEEAYRSSRHPAKLNIARHLFFHCGKLRRSDPVGQKQGTIHRRYLDCHECNGRRKYLA